MALPVFWVTASLVAFAAIGVGVVFRIQQQQPIRNLPAIETENSFNSDVDNVLKKDEEERVVYAIGDLHGDAECAMYWVNRLGLVKAREDESLEWTQPQASLVFMGDYCDKGPYSHQTMTFVKSLTDAFPDRVTALMGNHELELLRDRQAAANNKFAYHQLAYSAVHPQEYLHYLERDVDEDDEYVIDLLMNASLEVYSRRWHSSIMVGPEAGKPANGGGRYSILELFEENLRPLVSERLAEYQASYVKAFLSNTTLGKWVESLSVAHVAQGMLFTHGGVSRKIADVIHEVGGVQALNDLVQRQASDTTFSQFLETTSAGRAVYEMLVYRGNHKPEACGELADTLSTIDPALTRLAVGHTPAQSVRSLCEGRFWALDSLLGRWIRTSGNFYCPVEGRTSQDGSFTCRKLESECLGQVVKITEDNVQILQ